MRDATELDLSLPATALATCPQVGETCHGECPSSTRDASASQTKSRNARHTDRQKRAELLQLAISTRQNSASRSFRRKMRMTSHGSHMQTHTLAGARHRLAPPPHNFRGEAALAAALTEHGKRHVVLLAGLLPTAPARMRPSAASPPSGQRDGCRAPTLRLGTEF